MTIRDTDRTYRFIASLMAAGLLFLAACDNNDPGLLGPSTELTDSLTITFDRSPTPEPPIGLRRAEPRGAPEVVLPVERYTSVGAFSDRGGYRDSWPSTTPSSGAGEN